MTNTPTSWDESDDTTCAGIHNIASRLLHRSAGRLHSSCCFTLFDLHRWDHVTPGLHQPHWLPVHLRIHYKLCTIMQSIHVGRSPVYMVECVQTVADNASRSGLRSANSTLYVTPHLRTRFGEWHFHMQVRLLGTHFQLKFVMMPTFPLLQIN